MEIFNEQSDNQYPFGKGIQGAPGVGFLLTSDGNYDMTKKKLTNVADGTNPSDAVTKKQSDSASGGSGSVTKNIDLKNQFNILNNKTRTFDELKRDDESLVSFEEVKENFVGICDAKAIKTYLDMGNNFVYNVKTPTTNDQAANKSYDDKELSDSETAASMVYATKLKLDDYLKKDGSVSITGDLTISGNKIFNLRTPSSNSRPATKFYTDVHFLKLNGPSQMNGNLRM